MLVLTLILAVFPTEAEGAIYDDTIRLHILANSDSAEDQALKLRVRDAILLKYGDTLSECKSAEEAEKRLSLVLDGIEAEAKRIITDEGYSYDVHAAVSREWYDTREYENFTLPRGIYSSLRVIIGNGDGKNWWCVMYPPLCMEIATERAPSDDALTDYTSAETLLIGGGKYRVKFKILEMLSSAFTKNS